MGKNSCIDIKVKLSAYLDKELSLKECSLIDEHLQGCLSCQKDLSVLKSLRDKLNALAKVTVLKEPPNNLGEKIISGLPKYDLGIFTDPLVRNIAIGITTILILFTGVLKSFQKPSSITHPKNLISKVETTTRTVETKEENQKIVFPDGSALFLKENSRLKIKRFAPDIELILNKGTVLFSVIKSLPERNFIIQTPLFRLKVLGTLFKVSVEEERTEIIVLEGQVQLTNNSGDQILGRVKGLEKAVIAAGTITLPINTLSQEEIDMLKKEFAMAALIKRTPIPRNPQILWWREIKE